MTDALLVARLAQADGHDLVTLRALVEEASEMGARRALARLGLADEDAREDVVELRQLLKAWFPALALTVDLDQVSALSEERERLWGQVTAADFLTNEEKRAMLGIALIPLSPEGRGCSFCGLCGGV